MECLRKSREFERALAVQIIMLAPFAPHFASELWAIFCSAKYHLIDNTEVDLNKTIFEQKWPDIDMDYNLVMNVYVSMICMIPLLKYKYMKNQGAYKIVHISIFQILIDYIYM